MAIYGATAQDAGVTQPKTLSGIETDLAGLGSIMAKLCHST
jgi:hypothetical protein